MLLHFLLQILNLLVLGPNGLLQLRLLQHFTEDFVAHRLQVYPQQFVFALHFVLDYEGSYISFLNEDLPVFAVPALLVECGLAELPLQGLVLELKVLAFAGQQGQLIVQLLVEFELFEEFVVGLDELLLEEGGLGVHAAVQRLELSESDATYR